METTSKKFKSDLILEARASLKLGIPLVISQMCETGIYTANAVMMGLLGTQVLAAGALGALAFLTLLFACHGILSVGGSLAAEAFGANKIDEVSRIASGQIWLAVTLSLPAMLLLWHGDTILLLFGQEESNVLLTKTYLHSILWGFPAALSILTLRGIASALNVPRLITITMLTQLILNTAADYVLIFGKFGLPQLGLAGIGWATALGFWVSFTLGLILLIFSLKVRDYKLFRYLHQFDKQIFVKIFQTGWPMGFQWGAETALFNVTAWVAGYLGTVTLAAHDIGFQTAELAMVIPLGVGNVAMTRVGQSIGEKNPLGARRVASIGITIVGIYASIVALVFWLFPYQIAGIYLNINNPENIEAIKKATTFIPLAGLFQMFYSIQIIIVGALVGLRDTFVPVSMNLIVWGLGLAGSYFMAIILGWGGIGIWLAMVLSPLLSAVILTVRFYRVIDNLLANSDDMLQNASVTTLG
ncbi:MATE family efflux transporter [Cylindrospermopsis raciborskii]|uniref:Probable multidrug resistance protein NorM n=5 Tax=Cylindrospermopsis raciborskii TaxID=77022 RepID=A0A9Q5QVN4_9CYAN|nr:MATE family efflux transporter [Cylindrospermopsis raciborskii]ABI75096.1 sodium-driven multidrug and toxic compound extrusion protein [Cylindrospermopsis raciborskii T3]AFQ99035.1 SxtF [Cylindrospermopsis raciborskii ITEP-A3]AFQ99036.1 SxtF [Cylindrospermopsis raciborskii PMC00.01]QKS73456.1 sodium-driven multidrug and toxic compound extrusion protein [Cylindrospermopsis raciborskii CHAB3409]AFQ99037.1 SxtF [Cylindrospermopsis raciborskii MVCC14]